MPISVLIGSSPKFRTVLENVQSVAPVICGVLMQGELWIQVAVIQGRAAKCLSITSPVCHASRPLSASLYR